MLTLSVTQPNFDNDPVGILAKCMTLPFQGKEPKVYSTFNGFYIQAIEPYQFKGKSTRGIVRGITNIFNLGGAGHCYTYPIDEARRFTAKLWNPRDNDGAKRFFLLTAIALVCFRKKTYEGRYNDTGAAIKLYEKNIIKDCARQNVQLTDAETKIKEIWSETKLGVIVTQAEDAYFEGFGIKKHEITWERLNEIHQIEESMEGEAKQNAIARNPFWNKLLNTEPDNQEKWKEGILSIIKEADTRFQLYNDLKKKKPEPAE